MVVPSQYWTILLIEPGGFNSLKRTGGYKQKELPLAKEFFQQQFPELAGQKYLNDDDNNYVQATLLSLFRQGDSSIGLLSRFQAGFCLRCYISQSILDACKNRASHPNVLGRFNYLDLLSLALNDDGKTHIILDKDGVTQLILNSQGELQATQYKFFSVEIIRTFALNKTSLSNWAWKLTEQNQEIKKFLREMGCFSASDWSLLNRKLPLSLNPYLRPGDRQIVKAFHSVYRRDRLRLGQIGKKCREPTRQQLQEMFTFLQLQGVPINSIEELAMRLKEIAEILRQDKIFDTQVDPIEKYDDKSNEYFLNPDLPPSRYQPDLEAIERLELEQFLSDRLREILYRAIVQEMPIRVEKLQQSPSYARFASQFIEAYRLLYCEAMSLGNIARSLGMSGQPQASRVLQPDNLLNQVRYQVIDGLFQTIRETLNIEQISTVPDYLNSVLRAIETYIDEKCFAQAAAELQASKNREMKSLYAQEMCRYCQ